MLLTTFPGNSSGATPLSGKVPKTVTMPMIQVTLLDGFALRVDGQPVAVPPSSQRLLAFLAIHERPVARGALAAALWPDTTIRRAAACLRSALYRLVKPTHALVAVRVGALTL